MQYALCRETELDKFHCKGLAVEIGDGKVSIFIVNSKDGAYVYRNECPHTGVNLDWKKDDFLDLPEEYIQCATHGALFQIHDGYCIHGPCAGQNLIPVKMRNQDGRIILELP